MRNRCREALMITLLLMLVSQYCSNVSAQQQHAIVFSSTLGLTESFDVNAQFFSQNIPAIDVLREASLFLTEQFVFSDVFYMSGHAFPMELSIRDNIGLKLDNYRFTLSLDGLAFSEAVLESVERARAVGGMIISQVPVKNVITLLALLVGCIGLFFIVQGIKTRNDN